MPKTAYHISFKGYVGDYDLDRQSNASILELRNVISLHYSFYDGWRNVKILSSGECRKIRDYSIFCVNELEVFL